MNIDAAMRWFHFLGIITWIGGMMYHLVALQPFLKVQEIRLRIPLLFPVIRRFMMMTWSSITLLLLSGADMLIRVFVEQKISLNSRLGMLILFKIILFGLMLVIFGYIFFGYFLNIRKHYRALLRKPELEVADKHYQAIEETLVPIRNLMIGNLILGLTIILVVEIAIYT